MSARRQVLRLDPSGKPKPVAREDDAAFLARIGARVRAARRHAGMSRRLLSLLSGVSQRYLAKLEAGEGNVSLLVLRDVAAATGLPLEALLGDDELEPEALTLLAALRERSPAERREMALWLAGLDEGHDALRAGRIALVGLRGAGKSALGARAAEKLGIPFVELDREIEAEAGLAASTIFALYGEGRYRALERRCLQRLLARHTDLVLAVPGGLVTERESFDYLLAHCHVVWLRASPEDHMARVKAQGDTRPMDGRPRAMAELRALLKAREPLYAQAHATLDTGGRFIADSRDELLALIEELTPGRKRRPARNSEAELWGE